MDIAKAFDRQGPFLQNRACDGVRPAWRRVLRSMKAEQPPAVNWVKGRNVRKTLFSHFRPQLPDWPDLLEITTSMLNNPTTMITI
jgi:hypothetical protein